MQLQTASQETMKSGDFAEPLNNRFRRTEGKDYGLEQINIGLGKGKAIEEFSNNIINFEIIK
jgi:hypothetical protein